jgi:hypothetical protein
MKVRDGVSPTDCTVGGGDGAGPAGSNLGGTHYCKWNGSAWVFDPSTATGLDSLTLLNNVGSQVKLNGRWYADEIHAELDTTCTNKTTAPWSGCNGVLRAWVDGVMTHQYTGLNLGRTQGAANGHPNLGWYSSSPVSNYYHFESPSWGMVEDVDNWAISNTGTFIGCANTTGATTCPGNMENARGTGDAASPYGNLGPYLAFLGRHTGGDCTSNGYLGPYRYAGYRQSFAESQANPPTTILASLEPTASPGVFADTCATTISNMRGGLNLQWPGTIMTVTDGTDANDCMGGTGTTGHQHRCVLGADRVTWSPTTFTDNRLKIALTSSNTGAGVALENGLSNQVVFPQYVARGYIDVASGRPFT